MRYVFVRSLRLWVLIAEHQVSRDLAKTPGFSPTLNWVAVLLVALNPLTKLPLSLRPVRPS